jgi:hypothetical protein
MNNTEVIKYFLAGIGLEPEPQHLLVSHDDTTSCLIHGKSELAESLIAFTVMNGVLLVGLKFIYLIPRHRNYWDGVSSSKWGVAIPDPITNLSPQIAVDMVNRSWQGLAYEEPSEFELLELPQAPWQTVYALSVAGLSRSPSPLTLTRMPSVRPAGWLYDDILTLNHAYRMTGHLHHRYGSSRGPGRHAHAMSTSICLGSHYYPTQDNKAEMLQALMDHSKGEKSLWPQGSVRCGKCGAVDRITYDTWDGEECGECRRARLKGPGKYAENPCEYCGSQYASCSYMNRYAGVLPDGHWRCSVTGKDLLEAIDSWRCQYSPEEGDLCLYECHCGGRHWRDGFYDDPDRLCNFIKTYWANNS